MCSCKHSLLQREWKHIEGHSVQFPDPGHAIVELYLQVLHINIMASVTCLACNSIAPFTQVRHAAQTRGRGKPCSNVLHELLWCSLPDALNAANPRSTSNPAHLPVTLLTRSPCNMPYPTCCSYSLFCDNLLLRAQNSDCRRGAFCRRQLKRHPLPPAYALLHCLQWPPAA